MATQRRENFWKGKVWDAGDGAALWESVETRGDRLVADLFDLPSLYRPPTLPSFGTNALSINPWQGWSLNNPAFEEGAATSVTFSTATHGSLTGSVDITVASNYRMIFILGRYAAIESIDIVDADGIPGKDEVHHGIEYRVIMGNEYATPGDVAGLPPDLYSEIAAGSIPLVAIRRYFDGVSQSNTLTVTTHNRTFWRSRDEHTRMEALLTDRTLALYSPTVGNRTLTHVFTAAELPSVNLLGTYYMTLDASYDWVCKVDGDLITNDMLGGIDLVSDALPASGTRYIYLTLNKLADGVVYPSLVTATSIDATNGILLCTAVTAGGAPTVTYHDHPPNTGPSLRYGRSDIIEYLPTSGAVEDIEFDNDTWNDRFTVSTGDAVIPEGGVYAVELSATIGPDASAASYTFAITVEGTAQETRAISTPDGTERTVHLKCYVRADAGDLVGATVQGAGTPDLVIRRAELTLHRVR